VPPLPPVLPLGSLLSELAVDGIPKSCRVCVAPVVATTDGVVPVVVPEMPELVLLGSVLFVVIAVVPDVDEGATNVMLLDDPLVAVPAARLAEEIAALAEVAAAPSVANSPELEAVAEGLEPAVTVKLSDPSLEISQGAPAAGVPPSRLIPMT
jgi:hypothetical protein